MIKRCVLAIVLLSVLATVATANDSMYPPAPAAQKAIQIDGQGFTINGQRLYIASGSIHYARVPHELWRDRLLRLKSAGFNCVQTYAFWNFQEPRENQWDFTGDRDLGAFLDTAKELGLYAIVRVGPYVCAEWDSGGYPVWLRSKPPMKIRTADPEYLKWSDHWYDKILPLVAAHQINRGGNVIMVQLENEHPEGWGTVEGKPYFDHLRQKATALGIEVPYFFSGLNHGNGPWPDKGVAGRTTPWFTTEFWAGWFDLYDNMSKSRSHEVERDMWRILAHGGAGHNFYMLHGGSNFGAFGDGGESSYDYGSAIGEAGDLRLIYYRMKRANLLASLLPAMRAGGAGIGFDVNSAKAFTNAPIAEGVKLVSCSARILGAATKGKMTTLVVYGSSGDTGSLDFGDKQVTVKFPENGPQAQEITTGGHGVRVVAVNKALADRTWILGGYVICGPSFVSECLETGEEQPVVNIERPYGEPSCGKVIVYGAETHNLGVHSDSSLDTAQPPQLANWQMRLSPEAAAGFDDSTWLASDEPQQMGADGDNSAFAWYRASINVKAAMPGTLVFSNKADNLVVLVNGRSYDKSQQFDAGRNEIAVLASHNGRPKMWGYMGTLNDYERKGLFGPVQLDIGGENVAVKGWKMRGGAGSTDGDWQTVEDTGGTPAFYRATFQDKPVPGRILRLSTKQLSRGTAWLNGHNLGRYPQRIPCPGMYLPECWLNDGANTLVVFDEAGASPNAVALDIEKAVSREVIKVSEPCDAGVPMVVPKEVPEPVLPDFASKDNLALKKPAVASTSQPDNPPKAANDGDPETRWCTVNGILPQWWRVDLGKPCNLAGCEILWEKDGVKYQYMVEGSADLKDWSVLSDQRQTESVSQLQKLAFHAAAVRYVRITITSSPYDAWPSICDIKITGEETTPAPTPESGGK